MSRRTRQLTAKRRARQRVVDNEFGTMIVMRKQRCVRVTVVLKSTESFAYVDLDDSAVMRLMRRVEAIRGGKRALP